MAEEIGLLFILDNLVFKLLEFISHERMKGRSANVFLLMMNLRGGGTITDKEVSRIAVGTFMHRQCFYALYFQHIPSQRDRGSCDVIHPSAMIR